jgi:hypothetical protein
MSLVHHVHSVVILWPYGLIMKKSLYESSSSCSRIQNVASQDDFVMDFTQFMWLESQRCLQIMVSLVTCVLALDWSQTFTSFKHFSTKINLQTILLQVYRWQFKAFFAQNVFSFFFFDAWRRDKPQGPFYFQLPVHVMYPELVSWRNSTRTRKP